MNHTRSADPPGVLVGKGIQTRSTTRFNYSVTGQSDTMPASPVHMPPPHLTVQHYLLHLTLLTALWGNRVYRFQVLEEAARCQRWCRKRTFKWKTAGMKFLLQSSDPKLKARPTTQVAPLPAMAGYSPETYLRDEWPRAHAHASVGMRRGPAICSLRVCSNNHS